MALGFGGPGGHVGPGGPGGPGGHGGHGPGAPGGPGPGVHGGRGGGFFGHAGGFFGFAHFGFNSSGSAHGNNDTNFHSSAAGFNWRSPFPENALAQNPVPPTTGQERVDLFLINLHSVKRATFWRNLLSVILCGLVILNAALASKIHLFWIFLVAPSIILSPLITIVRTLLLDRYGHIFTNRLCAALGLILGIDAVICWFASSSFPRVFFAYSLTFIISTLINNYAFHTILVSQAYRCFDDNSRTFRRRFIGASNTARIFELIIFIPCAFASKQGAAHNIWLGICLFSLCLLVDFILSPITYAIRNQLAYHLSADFNIIVDE